MITAKQQSVIIRSLLVLAVLMLAMFSALLVTKTAHAQEINPTPGTYSYGSTSEFSPYVSLSTSSSSSLAQTGMDQTVGYMAVLVTLAGAVAAIYYYRKTAINS